MFYLANFYMVWKMLMASVPALIAVVLTAEHVEAGQQFGLSYAKRSSLQAYNA